MFFVFLASTASKHFQRKYEECVCNVLCFAWRVGVILHLLAFYCQIQIFMMITFHCEFQLRCHLITGGSCPHYFAIYTFCARIKRLFFLMLHGYKNTKTNQEFSFRLPRICNSIDWVCVRNTFTMRPFAWHRHEYSFSFVSQYNEMDVRCEYGENVLPNESKIIMLYKDISWFSVARFVKTASASNKTSMFSFILHGIFFSSCMLINCYRRRLLRRRRNFTSFVHQAEWVFVCTIFLQPLRYNDYDDDNNAMKCNKKISNEKQNGKTLKNLCWNEKCCKSKYCKTHFVE